jgi:hypothetical protein
MRHGTKTKNLMQETALWLCVAQGVTETTLRDMATAAGLARGEIPQPGFPFPGLPGGRGRRSRAQGLVARVGSGCHRGTQHGFP